MRLVLCRCLLILALASAVPASLHADGSKLVQGDVISVLVDGEKEFTKPYQIDSHGYITMPMVKPVSVIGLSTSEASAAIAKSLADVLVNPQVTVSFVERARMQVFVIGEVRAPGPSQVGLGDRVIQALAQAGYGESADLSRVSVRRGDQVINCDLTKYLKGDDLTSNIELQSGDTIVVPLSTMVGTIVVSGQVAKSGSLPLKRGMTFREAIGVVGGVTPDADTEKITIKHEDALEPIHVDYKRAMDGDPSADLALRPNDTVYVPLSTAVGTIMVSGQVAKSGPLPLKRGMTFREAIGIVGGVTPDADTEKITIKHEEASDPVHVDYKRAMDGDPSADLALRPNDTVYIPLIENSYFTVLGGVQRPGQFPFRARMTLSEAVGVAGGAIPQGGDLRNVSLTRSIEKGKPGQTIKVNLKDVMAKAKEQPIIERGDVIYVKTTKPATPFLQMLSSLMPFAWLFH